MVESGKRLVQGRDLIPHINVLACTRDVRDGKGKSEASPSPSSPSRRVATRDSGTFRSTFYPRRRQGPRLPDRTVERRRARATCPAGGSSKPSPGHRIRTTAMRSVAKTPTVGFVSPPQASLQWLPRTANWQSDSWTRIRSK